MKRTIAVCVLLFATCAGANGQSLLPYQFSVDGARLNRYLGSERVGTITNGSIRYYVDTPDRTRVLALEYANAENRVHSSHGLELDEESLDIGVCAPLSPVEVKLASTVNRYALGSDYWALGVYPRFPVKVAECNLGGERDADGTVHLGGYLARDYLDWSGFLGASHERSSSMAGVLNEERYGAMLERWFGGLSIFEDPFLMIAAGTAVNPNEGPTWLAGLAHPCVSERSGMNPACFLMGRHKPEADYILGIATLWGRVLNDRVCSAIAESFFNGALSRSRVVRNRDFNTLGVGKGYDAVDFGRVTATFTSVNVSAGMGAHLRESQAGLYGTLARSYGPIHNPYLGVECQTSTDLVFNPRTHSLDDPDQEWKTIILGCKFHVNEKEDPTPRKRPGYLRIESSFRFDRTFDGAFLTATLWQ
jgi:hypothetical protein